MECAKLRPKAGIALGDECADALEKLARKARELEFIAKEYVEQIRVGEEIVAMWADQNWVERVKASIVVGVDREDSFSQGFETLMKKLFATLGLPYERRAAPLTLIARVRALVRQWRARLRSP